MTNISKVINFIGVDVHLKRFTAACLDHNLKILFIDNFFLEELTEKISCISPQIIAVDAPLGLNIGLMDDEQYRKKLGLTSEKHHNKKVSEYELTRRGIFLYPSPRTMEDISGWKNWMGTGFQLYDKLKQLDYTTANTNNSCEKRMVEVFPHASFTTLAGRLLEKKSTDTGLHERMKLLENVGVNNVMEYMTGTKHIIGDKLDAIVAAYTAYTIWKGQASAVGDPVEGIIALPVVELKDKYTKGLSASENKDDDPVQVEIGSYDSDSLSYSYKNVDAVVWLKYFTTTGNIPDIYKVINFVEYPCLKVTLKIISEQGNQIEATFEAMKNRVDGMKVIYEDKQRLKDYWGSHGDKKEYWVTIVNRAMK